MANIIIIGAGAIGSAFSVPCLDRQHKVNIVGTHLEENFIGKIKNNNNWHPALQLHLAEKTNFVKFSNLTVYHIK